MVNENETAAANGDVNLHLDEVTGEKVSKSELKRRMKQREKDAAKAAANKTKEVKPAGAGAGAEPDEDDLDPNVSQQGKLCKQYLM
jgi:lysyl-tRNA synthetase class 2